jgi:HD superfamily phosphodiesterase
MKNMLKCLAFVGLLVGMTSYTFAADKTWIGKISDSMCGASHAKMSAGHPGAKMTDAECTAACVKSGAKYVFVMNGKVYDIANQQFADLSKEAGRTVKLTGEMNGETITISKLAMSTRAKKT